MRRILAAKRNLAEHGAPEPDPGLTVKEPARVPGERLSVRAVIRKEPGLKLEYRLSAAQNSQILFSLETKVVAGSTAAVKSGRNGSAVVIDGHV